MSSDHRKAGPSGAQHDTSSKVHNALTGPSRPAQPAKGGHVKTHAQRGRHAGNEDGDLVHEGEDATWPLSRFKVDRHPSKITTREFDVIRELYHVPDYVEF